MKKLIYISTLTFNLLNTSNLKIDIKKHSHPILKINTLYGRFDITEPVIKEIILHPMFQRLRFIHQYGLLDYVKASPKDFSRFEHSIGVFVLLKKYGCSIEEQIAGLLHDASHTVFSHVGDYVFKSVNKNNSYQDDIHEWFLEVSGLGKVVENHGFKIKDILHKNINFKALEQELPNICADRLEYNLRGGIITNLLVIEDIKAILTNLKFENNIWFFTDTKIAKKFALVSLYHTENIWTSARTSLIDMYAAKALKRAVKIKLISIEDIHFSLDHIVWEKLKNSQDPNIKRTINRIINIDSRFRLASENEPYNHCINEKFRGIDPWIKINNEFKRLSELDKDFKQKFLDTKNKLDKGWNVILN